MRPLRPLLSNPNPLKRCFERLKRFKCFKAQSETLATKRSYIGRFAIQSGPLRPSQALESSNSIQGLGWRMAWRQDRTELDDESERFRYDSLASQDSIRLIELLPGAWDDDISCNILPVKLEALPSYVALSYTWGDDRLDDPGQSTDFASRLSRAMFPVQHFIRCNTKLIPVSTNLYNALRRLREQPSSNYIWIDYLCIDQSNIPERNEQIQNMRHIYSNARMVPIWLGEEDDMTSIAFTMIKKLSQLDLTAQDFHARTSDIYDPDAMLALGLPSLPSVEWECLHKLFERRWFQRTWIIQEVALASIGVTICGSKSINWDDIGRAAQYLVITGYFRALQDVYGREGRPTFASSIQNCRAGVKLEQDQDLTLLLSSMRRFKATDPRDKIFSLLGIAKAKTGDVDQYAIQADYSDEVAEVFRSVTSIVVRKDSSLALLSTVEDATLTKTQGLPSWVPDYSTWQEATILGMPQNPHNYHAAGNTLVNVHESAPELLVLDALHVDTIKDVAPYARHMSWLTLLSWLRLGSTLPETYVNGGTNYDAMWRTFIGNFGGATNPAHVDYKKHFTALLRFLLDSEGEDTGDSSEDREEDVGVPMSKGLEQLMRDLTAEHHERDGNRHLYFVALVYIAGLRCFFVTHKGYMGLGPRSMQPGDEVFIFSGADVPFVLRKSGFEEHRLVGEAYVHGIMEGEVLNETSLSFSKVCIR